MKPRHPVTWEGAITRIRGMLGLAAAEAIGVSDSHLYKLGDPDQPETVNVTQALKLDLAYLAAGGAEPPIFAVYVKRLEAARAGATHASQSPPTRFLAVVREIGEIGSAVETALADGVMSANDAVLLQKEIADASEMLGNLSRDVDALATGKISERRGE